MITSMACVSVGNSWPCDLWSWFLFLYLCVFDVSLMCRWCIFCVYFMYVWLYGGHTGHYSGNSWLKANCHVTHWITGKFCWDSTQTICRVRLDTPDESCRSHRVSTMELGGGGFWFSMGWYESWVARTFSSFHCSKWGSPSCDIPMKQQWHEVKCQKTKSSMKSKHNLFSFMHVEKEGFQVKPVWSSYTHQLEINHQRWWNPDIGKGGRWWLARDIAKAWDYGALSLVLSFLNASCTTSKWNLKQWRLFISDYQSCMFKFLVSFLRVCGCFQK